MKFADLDLNKAYSYADYVKWDFKERVELIMGKIFRMSQAPNSRHQLLSFKLSGFLWDYIKGHPCQVFPAPFDVRIPRRSIDDQDIITVVQPDLSVVCDKSKIDMRGCVGAPDIVVEILSPGNNNVELNNKFDIYQEAGVKEYWIISPQDNTFIANTLTDGKYVTSRPLTAGAVFTSSVLPGFSLVLSELFKPE
jgi:Uma2 family endonuclease